MRSSKLFFLACTASLGLSVALSGLAHAESPSPAGEDYGALAKLPSWVGGWTLSDESFRATRASSGSLAPNDPNVPDLTPDYAAKRRANGAANHGQGPAKTGVINNAARCLPPGMPQMMTTPFTFEFLFTPGRVTILSEDGEVRRIYTDGRSHPDDPDSTFNGDSIGHWEGDTLIVDTIAIKPEAEYFMGLRESGQAHVIERLHRKDEKTFQIDTEVIDPVAFKTPFKYSRFYDHVTTPMIPYVCLENNRDLNKSVDLTPPK